MLIWLSSWPFQQPFGKEWLGKLTWRRPLWPKMKVMISCTLPSRNVMKDLSRWGQIFALPLVFSFHLPPPPFWSTASRYISCLRIFAALFSLYNKWCQRDEADPCRGIYWLAFDYNGAKLEGTSKGFFFLFHFRLLSFSSLKAPFRLVSAGFWGRLIDLVTLHRSDYV